MEDNYLEQYFQLRDEIDMRANQLNILHTEAMHCKKGCSTCCENISVFPLEFFAIKKELENTEGIIKKRFFNRFRKSCIFLVDNACAIYKSRPIICRTQGLPLMYQNLTGDAYEISYCPINFKDYPLTDFVVENTMYMPSFNSKLYLLNKSYVENTGSNKPKRRIPLYKLL